MATLYTYLLVLHISAGTLSLLTFFLPMVARKGSPLHNKSGRVYVWGMWTVVLTALLLCGVRLYQGTWVMASFLGFLAVLTSKPLYYGIAVLRRDPAVRERGERVATVLTLLTVGLAVPLLALGAGLLTGGVEPLALVFSIIGLTATPEAIRRARGTYAISNRTLAHVTGMLTSAIAAFTAFFALGGRNLTEGLGGSATMITLWVAPTVLGTMAISYFKRVYLPRQRVRG